MNRVSTELWRKPESVSLDKFPSTLHASIRKGLQVMRGEIPDDSVGVLETNEEKVAEATHFSVDEMNLLREKLGPELIHGEHTLQELKEIIEQEKETSGHSLKRR